MDLFFGAANMLWEIIELLIEFMGEDQFWSMLATGVAAYWAWVQRQIGVDRKENAAYDSALEFLEAGVMKTYHEFVKQRKLASADGTLTEEEKLAARQMAFDTAKNYAVHNGIDLVKTLGAYMIPTLIEKTVGGLKREAGGVFKLPETTTTTPPTVTPTV